MAEEIMIQIQAGGNYLVEVMTWLNNGHYPEGIGGSGNDLYRGDNIGGFGWSSLSTTDDPIFVGGGGRCGGLPAITSSSCSSSSVQIPGHHDDYDYVPPLSLTSSLITDPPVADLKQIIMSNEDQIGPSPHPPVAAFKRPRIQIPTPLPTFKVRKEKLSDRVTALQQLVSPFGKTDTASVLDEAIDYIKFLHHQLTVLTTSYMKNSAPAHRHPCPCQQANHSESNQDLRSQGLCLVPISSTFSL